MAASRSADPEAGPADGRMAAYLEGRHHPRQGLPARVAYVARGSDGVLGYIAGHLTVRFGCHGEVQYLYVAQAWRRTGIATMLLQHLARWFVEHGATRVCVDVDARSSGAGQFYANHGADQLQRHWMVWRDIRTVLEAAQ